MTIGGSNQIIKGDERDEIPTAASGPVISKDSIDSVVPVPMAVSPGEGKSERVQRHAIQARADEERNENDESSAPTTNASENQTAEPVTDQQAQGESMAAHETESAVGTQTEAVMTSQTETKPEPVTGSQTETQAEPATGSQTEAAGPQIESADVTQAEPITSPQTEALSEGAVAPSDSSSTATSQLVSTTPLPAEWLGYYDFGVHKPEFIRNVEFTTRYPSQFVGKDFHYVTYEAPFKPSLPDYTDAHSSRFFFPLRYFKR